MLYTRKGDLGTSKVLNKEERISKDSLLFEVLGSVDELNAWLGVCKFKSKDMLSEIMDLKIFNIVDRLQQDLFIIQAELAGAEMKISEDKIIWMEKITDEIEKVLPKIESFFVPGGSEESALLDVGRTIARRVERVLIRGINKGEALVCDNTRRYLNRLSSVLYALVRLANIEEGVKEERPNYN